MTGGRTPGAVTRRLLWVGAAIAAVLVVASLGLARPALPQARSPVPTAKVVRGPLKLTVYATGELRAGQTVNLMAPSAGGQIRIMKLLQTGTQVKAGDVVMEFDPSDQQFALEEAESAVAEADQEIAKMRADNDVQASQDKLNLLTAQYDVRRAELDTADDEFIGAIDAKKNELTLDEDRRHLQQLQQDAAARQANSNAGLAVVLEKRNKAEIDRTRAKSIIDSLVVKTSIAGVVSVKENHDGQQFYYGGMVLPEYREGDTTYSGRNVADVVENGRMDVSAKITETDRENIQQGQKAAVKVDAIPGKTFTATVGALTDTATRGAYFETTAVRQFEISLSLDHPDPGMHAGSSVRVVIDGRELNDVLHVPRQAVFDRNGKNFVYLQVGNRFDRHDVTVANVTESRAVVFGLNAGDVIALVDPDIALHKTKPAAGPIGGGGGAQ
ncbi:MAG: efflux RND transporter periplasmic adaptor subunit [Vicinamibacterales bacterium]